MAGHVEEQSRHTGCVLHVIIQTRRADVICVRKVELHGATRMIVDNTLEPGKLAMPKENVVSQAICCDLTHCISRAYKAEV